ncbi:hypothetical protein LZ32DRAFT_391865 [Colletotrichum eremochloae]|nr:hypothetical protein LZ32DRAFT_391865 [Colletotrichum eremochloae]
MVQRVVAEVHFQLVNVVGDGLRCAAAPFAAYAHLRAADIPMVFPDGAVNSLVAIGLSFEDLPDYGRSVDPDPFDSVDVEVGPDNLGHADCRNEGDCRKSDPYAFDGVEAVWNGCVPWCVREGERQVKEEWMMGQNRQLCVGTMGRYTHLVPHLRRYPRLISSNG